MSDWIPIGEPEAPVLTPTQQRIRELLREGKKVYEIVWAVHMGKDFVLEEIYQIRKWESIMGKKPKFNKTERAELLRLHNEERYSVGKLAAKYSCSQTAIKNALNAAKIEAEDEPMQHTGINKEFDAAVDEMIAESKAMDLDTIEELHNAEIGHSADDLPAEKDTLDTKSDTSEPEPLEDCENGIPNTPLVPQPKTALPKLPDVIFDALNKHIFDLKLKIRAREHSIEELKADLVMLENEKYAVEQWLEDHT